MNMDALNRMAIRGFLESMKNQAKGSQLHIVVILLILVTIAAYLPALRADFVNYDDEQYVTRNPHVQTGLTANGFKWAFNVGYECNWHPLTWISHMLDRQAFGPGPVGPHAVNLLLHLANTILLLLVLNSMTKSLWKSAFVAALFAVHPMHVESVAWVAERKDVLSALFWMLTMWAYMRYTEAPGLKRYIVVVVLFALGLMSKPTLVTLPLVLLLLDYWPLGRWSGATLRMIREKLPLFVMSAASCVVTYLAQQRGGAVMSVSALPFSQRAANALTAYVSYVGKMLWPAKLAVQYPHPYLTPVWQAAGAAMILVVITVFVIRLARSRPYLVVGWLWYLIVLLPMIGLVQVGDQAIADRYTYISFIGLFVILVWGAFDLFGSRFATSPNSRVVSILVIITLAVCTWRQCAYWHDSVSLWKHTLAVTSKNSIAHYSLGVAYGELGRRADAIAEYKRAIRIRPKYSAAYYDLGVAYGELGRYVDAVEAYQQAISAKPEVAEAHNNLAISYGKLGMYAGAIDEYNEAIRINPEYFEAHYGLALILMKEGFADEAEKHLREAIRIKPTYASAYNNLGILLGGRKRYDEAASCFAKAVKYRPDYPEAHSNLAIALFAAGRYQESYKEIDDSRRYGVKFPSGFLKALSAKSPAR